MMKIKKKIKFNFFDVFIYSFCGLFSLICFYPLWYVFIGSLTPLDVISSSLFLPKRITFEYYETILQGKLFVNSIFISFTKTLLGSLGALTLTSMTAYGIAKKEIIGMKTLNFMMVFLMFFGAGLIPTYLLFIDLSLIGTFWVMVIPGFVSIGHFIIMRNYFEYNVSKELENAATIDGANEIIMFFKIIIPISMPMLAAILMFEAVGHWNDWSSYIYFVNKSSIMPFIVVLQEILKNPNSYLSAQSAAGTIGFIKPTTPEGLTKATIIVAMVPIMCLYPFLQKHFAKGIMIGAVKG